MSTLVMTVCASIDFFAKLHLHSAMAEIIGLALAIPPTVGLAIGLSEYLCKMKRHIDAADQEIDSFSIDVELFAKTTQLCFDTLSRVWEKLRHSSSPVFRYLHAEGILENLATYSRLTKGHISKAWDYTESIQSRVKWWTRLRWVGIKPDVMALRADMTGLGVSLSLILNVIILEMTKVSISDSTSQEAIEERDQKM